MFLESFTGQPCRRSLSELDLLVKFYRFFSSPGKQIGEYLFI